MLDVHTPRLYGKKHVLTHPHVGIHDHNTSEIDMTWWNYMEIYDALQCRWLHGCLLHDHSVIPFLEHFQGNTQANMQGNTQGIRTGSDPQILVINSLQYCSDILGLSMSENCHLTLPNWQHEKDLCSSPTSSWAQMIAQNIWLVGDWPTPLKNDGVRQLGWWHSQYMEK